MLKIDFSVWLVKFHLQMTFLLGVNVVKRNVGVIGLLVNKHRVALGKCSSTYVLATNPYIETYFKELNNKFKKKDKSTIIK